MYGFTDGGHFRCFKSILITFIFGENTLSPGGFEFKYKILLLLFYEHLLPVPSLQAFPELSGFHLN